MAADFYPSPLAQNQPANPSLVTYTHIIYALHTIAVVMGIATTAATVVGGFIFSIPSIVAVIMNYARRSEVRATWLESHFTWQIRTFWYALLWAVVIGLVGLVLAGPHRLRGLVGGRHRPGSVDRLPRRPGLDGPARSAADVRLDLSFPGQAGFAWALPAPEILTDSCA